MKYSLYGLLAHIFYHFISSFITYKILFYIVCCYI
nr:MAG TPA: hypothetical protein [Crassvirales sp.]